jgi:hypothetical protein
MSITGQPVRRGDSHQRIHDSVVPPEIRPERLAAASALSASHPPHDCSAFRHPDGAIKAVSDATGHVEGGIAIRAMSDATGHVDS